jgi:hypothetical protein
MSERTSKPSRIMDILARETVGKAISRTNTALMNRSVPRWNTEK